jgi:hypothetical protein
MEATRRVRALRNIVGRVLGTRGVPDQQMLALGALLSETVRRKKEIASLGEVEFSIFSQFGDDGIIQWLVNALQIANKTFIEFGVSDYRESNTRFLLMHDNWSGFVVDSSQNNVDCIVNSEYFWKYQLHAESAFVDAENVNDLLLSSQIGSQVGILHIDVDGNDYWIWKAIDAVVPEIAIIEYNSVFGIDRPITVPYDRGFSRNRAHFSNLYFGASLRSLYDLGAEKGYAFIGCNTAGNNAYFVRRDRLNEAVREVSLESGYVVSKFRDSRGEDGRLTYLSGGSRLEAIRGMPVYNTDTHETERL